MTAKGRMSENAPGHSSRGGAVPLYPPKESDDLSSHAQRQLIGVLGLLLPILLPLVSGWRPTGKLPRWELLESVSAYYHTGAVAVFVGVLSTLAAFLFTYRGYGNADRRRDRIASAVAGVAASFVAFFPTAAPLGVTPPTWWTWPMIRIHNVSAAVLFGAFAFFSLVLFPKSRPTGGASATGKKWRNGVYVFCGIMMLICVLWAGSSFFTQAPVFWPETLALWFFAASWLAKGRADWTARAAGLRTMGYAARVIGGVGRALRR